MIEALNKVVDKEREVEIAELRDRNNIVQSVSDNGIGNVIITNIEEKKSVVEKLKEYCETATEEQLRKDLEALNKFNLSGVSVDEFIKQQESYLRLKQIKNNNEMNEKEFDATSGIPQEVYEAAVNEVLFGKPELPKASDYILSYEGFRDLCAKYIQEHLDKEVLAKEGVITIHMPIGQYAYRQNYPERLRNELVGLGWDEELTRVDYFTTTEHPDCLHITLGIFNQHRKHD